LTGPEKELDGSREDIGAGMYGFELPGELAELVRGYSVEKVPWEASGAEIFVLRDGGEVLYLKSRVGGDWLLRESRVLGWIGGRLPVPELLFYGASGRRELLLTTEVKGTPVYRVEGEDRRDAVVATARALRMIHSLDVEGCPYAYPLQGKLNEIRGRLGDAPEVAGLREGVPAEELVFTHGDYCLPNVLVFDGGLRGIIDWNYGGLADRYVDFVLCIWSMGFNFGVEETERRWTPLFLEEYGIELDPSRFEYFGRVNALTE